MGMMPLPPPLISEQMRHERLHVHNVGVRAW